MTVHSLHAKSGSLSRGVLMGDNRDKYPELPHLLPSSVSLRLGTVIFSVKMATSLGDDMNYDGRRFPPLVAFHVSLTTGSEIYRARRTDRPSWQLENPLISPGVARRSRQVALSNLWWHASHFAEGAIAGRSRDTDSTPQLDRVKQKGTWPHQLPSKIGELNFVHENSYTDF